ncbi:NlpC/P60 family protein [Poseidonocella sedimentorum]|uniref:Putative phage cell wall peptidase, NlpC/P60 family n=1 Tax=Poseidonocella sedimentorum TaxID=871652 RepID=A0A1I6DH05_9RHOB|nr:NlpC/P60 family protein [Poseidonocella sedimentorum]SFR04724.1 putative phage cell wall peptidase, NlpC/P60 family [Poseidonocella sedimentorum]
MSASGAEVVRAARQWIGTPYVHQGRCLGAGCDCLGLILGVWGALGGPRFAKLPRYSPDWAESGSTEQLLGAATDHLVPASGAQAEGQVLLFRLRDRAVAKHLGILSQTGAAPRFIHAYSGHGVVESPLSEPWARRIVARFEFP